MALGIVGVGTIPAEKMKGLQRCPMCAARRWQVVVEISRQKDPTLLALSASGTARISRCQGCGLMMTDPFPEVEQIPLFYPADSYPCYLEGKNSGEFKRIIQRWVVHSAALVGWNPLKKLWKLLLLPVRRRVGGIPQARIIGSVLDAGCGDGTFLELLKEAGWQVEGFEMSPEAAEAARRRGLRVQTGTMESIDFPQGRFAAIRLWHVLEHLADPLAALKKMKGWLRPGGELIIGIPNVASFYARAFGPRWSAWEVPRHLYHFTPQTIRQLLEKSGFDSIRVDHCSVGTGVSSLGENFSRLFWLRVLGLLGDIVLDGLKVGDSLEVRATRPS